MSPSAYALLGLTAIIGALVAILAFAVTRFAAAARDARRNLRECRMESALLSSALEEAIAKLKAQEHAASTRAEASERLSEQIVASLTSGLMVVGLDNRVQIRQNRARMPCRISMRRSAPTSFEALSVAAAATSN